MDATATVQTLPSATDLIGHLDAPDRIGPLLIRLRRARGLTQRRVADRLCHASGRPTLTRNDVSRWEREERVPATFWLGWLAVVLEAPLERLEEAVAFSCCRPASSRRRIAAANRRRP